MMVLAVGCEKSNRIEGKCVEQSLNPASQPPFLSIWMGMVVAEDRRRWETKAIAANVGRPISTSR